MPFLVGDTMADSKTKDIKDRVEIPSHPQQDRRAQPRSETVFCRIEDATYAVLRKHEKKSA